MLDNPIDDSLMQYISLPSGAWTVLVRRVYYSTAQRKLQAPVVIHLNRVLAYERKQTMASLTPWRCWHHSA